MNVILDYGHVALRQFTDGFRAGVALDGEAPLKEADQCGHSLGVYIV